jgi:hypothetical protein
VERKTTAASLRRTKIEFYLKFVSAGAGGCRNVVGRGADDEKGILRQGDIEGVGLMG